MVRDVNHVEHVSWLTVERFGRGPPLVKAAALTRI